MKNKPPGRHLAQNLFFAALLSGMYLTTFVNYLLFHSLAEFFSIVVAFSFFTIAWNAKAYIRNQYLLFIGIAYLFIAFLDLLHTLSYKGMPIFTDYDYYANQLWIGARYMESISLLIAFLFLGKDKSYHPENIFLLYLVTTALLVISIFYLKIFPECFVEGSGLTPFKKVSEYIICLILAAGLVLLYRHRDHFDTGIFKILLASIICTIVSELAFTIYISNYGLSNLVGHYFKLFSFYLIYIAIIQTGIRQPYHVIFKELDAANKALSKEIVERKKIEKLHGELILELQQAMANVKKLSGLLPICAHCKKIRDDKGYWNRIESYIQEHSEAEFSHGICRECAEKYFPDIDIDNP